MKEKVSITIDEDILKHIEEIAAKKGINRSQYIEQLIQAHAKQVPVLILAANARVGGEDKSLKEYKHQKLIERQLSYLEHQGITDVFISTDSKKLKAYLEKEHPRITVIFESKPIGSAGTIKRAKELLGRKFLFMYCDIILDLDLNELIKFHLRNKSSMTLALKSSKHVSQYGVAILEGSQIIKFEEKPEKSESHLIYIGVGIIEPNAAEQLKSGKFELQLNNIENKYGYIYEGCWKSFEKEKDYG